MEISAPTFKLLTFIILLNNFDYSDSYKVCSEAVSLKSGAEKRPHFFIGRIHVLQSFLKVTKVRIN